jgi:hypothetical protein
VITMSNNIGGPHAQPLTVLIMSIMRFAFYR